MIERMLAIYKTVGRAHGMWLAPIGSGIGFLVLRTVVFFSMLLDNLRTERLWEGEVLIPGHPDLMEIPLLGTSEVAYIRRGLGT